MAEGAVANDTVLSLPYLYRLPESYDPARAEATLDRVNAEGPFTVERATALDPAAWPDFRSNAVAPLVLPLEGGSGFYWVVGK